MRRTRATDNVGVKPAKVDTETGGYYDEGPPATVFSADDANMFQEELVAVATMKGASLDATGANDHQCADALAGVKAIEARNAEATGIDSYWSMAVIASDNATVGEDTGGVVHCAVVASNVGSAKGFQSAVIASETSLAGATGGSVSNAAIVASYYMVAEGDESFVAACKADVGDVGDRMVVSGDQCAAIAVLATDAGFHLQGTASMIAAAEDCSCDGVRTAIIGGRDHVLEDAGGSARNSVILGGEENTVSGDDSATVGGWLNEIEAAASRVVIAGGISDAITGDAIGAFIGGGGACEIDDTISCGIIGGETNIVSGVLTLGSVILGGENNEVSCTQSLIGASADSKVRSNAGGVTPANVALLASSYCDFDAGSSATAKRQFCVAGGYHASTLTAPSWRIESNGGTMRSTAAHTTSGLDYAEMFANKDGKAHRAGKILALVCAKDDQPGCRLAQPGDVMLGGVSVNPTVLGGDDGIAWAHRIERDEWGAIVYEDVEHVTKLGPDPKLARERRRREQAHKRAVAARAKWLRSAGQQVAKAQRAVDEIVAEVVAHEAEAARLNAAADALSKRGAVKRLLKIGAKREAAARTAAVAAGVLAAVATQRADAARSEVARLEGLRARIEATAIPAPDLTGLEDVPRERREMVRQPRLNAAWERERAQVSRRDRPDDWTAVGLLGQLRIEVSSDVVAGDMLMPGRDGQGVPASRDYLAAAVLAGGVSMRVMKVTQTFDKAKGYAIALCLVG